MKTFMMIILILVFSTVALEAKPPPPTGSGLSRVEGCAAIEGKKIPVNVDEAYQMGICLGQLNTALYFLAQEECFHTKDLSVYNFAVMVNRFMRENPDLRLMDFNKIMYLAAGITYDCKTNTRGKT